MKRMLQGLILAGTIGASLFVGSVSTTQAQDPYWNNHWRWHNNTYRPYYHRYYGPTVYTTPPVYNGYYNNGYNNGYYYAPGTTYYGPGYYGGGGVQVGPMRFGWW